MYLSTIVRKWIPKIVQIVRDKVTFDRKVFLSQNLKSIRQSRIMKPVFFNDFYYV